MNFNHIKKSVCAVLLGLTLSGGAAYAGGLPVKVTAKLDSVQILMGRLATLDLEVVQPEEAKGDFPLLSEAARQGYAAVCGDSVELSAGIRRDTVRLGSGRIQINCKVPVQAFDSGFYRLPEMAYVVGRDTAWSNAVNLKVVPVDVKDDEQISDYAPVSKPDGSSWTDMLPDWLYYYWWVALICLVLLAVVGWTMLRRKKGAPLLPSRPEVVLSPSEEALRRLGLLKERKLWEKGMEKEYFTDLTEILRNYLDRAFGINAMEMTSRQIMQTLAGNRQVADKRELVRQILDMADFVKFAKVRPLPADNVAAFDNAVAFVKSTSEAADGEKGGEDEAPAPSAQVSNKDNTTKK